MSLGSAPRLDAIEAMLADLIPDLCPPATPRGRPEVLPGTLLWTGLLVGILRGQGSQQALWRLLSQAGLWDFPRVPVTAEAVRIRLQRSGPTVMQDLFAQVSAALAASFAPDEELAPFAGGVYAIDESTLDRIARTLPTLRDVPAGDDRLLPGKLITAFDVRAQQFHTVQTTELPRQNEKVAAHDLVATLPAESLILADLGYFSFPWFDALTDAAYWYVSKLREKTSTTTAHVLAERGPVRDELVWLGAHRANRAKHLVRRIQVPVGDRVQVYLTNVLDPERLSIAEVVRLYARRWDIELAFKTIKRDLGLHLLWSAKWELILTQVFGVLVIAQIAMALRAEIARRAAVDLFDVSLPLLLRDAPYLVRDGRGDVLDRIAALPRVRGGYLRPSRRYRPVVPEDLVITPPPEDLLRERTPRYDGRRCGPEGGQYRPIVRVE